MTCERAMPATEPTRDEAGSDGGLTVDRAHAIARAAEAAIRATLPGAVEATARTEPAGARRPARRFSHPANEGIVEKGTAREGAAFPSAVRADRRFTEANPHATVCALGSIQGVSA